MRPRALGHRRTVRVSAERLVAVPVAALHAAPDDAAMLTSQLLFGEAVNVMAEPDGTWSHVRATLDGYEGFVHSAALAQADHPAPSHVVTVRGTLLFPGPGIKAVPARRLPLGARLRPVPDAARTHEGLDDCGAGWVHHAHLASLEAPPTRRRLIDAAADWSGAPYLWGGRTPDGCDCSGLVQGVARACGLALPRDSGEQERALAHTVPIGERRLDDLVFWPGHVAIVAHDPALVLHANAHTMSVAVEPLVDVVRRAGEPSSVRRPRP